MNDDLGNFSKDALKVLCHRFLRSYLIGNTQLVRFVYQLQCEASPANGESEAGQSSNEVPKGDSNKASSLLCSGAWNLFEHMIAYLPAKAYI